MDCVKDCCLKITGKRTRTLNNDLIKKPKLNNTKQAENKNIISSPPVIIELVKNKNYIGPARLTCTHCGEKIPKPNIPVDYIISCVKCFRPLDLPAKYYKK